MKAFGHLCVFVSLLLHSSGEQNFLFKSLLHGSGALDESTTPSPSTNTALPPDIVPQKLNKVHLEQLSQLKGPKNIRIGWKTAAPFIFNTPSNSTDKQSAPKLRGIVFDVLKVAFKICCQMTVACGKPNITYLTERNSTLQLDVALETGEATVILPVRSVDGGKTYGGSYKFVGVLRTPGVVLIMNRELVDQDGRVSAWKALAQTWPIVAISLILSALAGICVWALDTVWNPSEFPRPFTRGSLEGFWWAFVTMTTVGYGDRAPKSHCARMFGIIWIMVGLTVCSILTATLTSALTAVSTEEEVKIMGEKVAVLAENDLAFEEGVRRAAEIKLYQTPEEMYKALVGKSIFGVLDEMHSGLHFIEKFNDSRLFVAKLIEKEASIGFAAQGNLQKVSSCLTKLFQLRQKDMFIIINKYTASKLKLLKPGLKDTTSGGAIISLIDTKSAAFWRMFIILGGCFGVLVTLGILDQFVRRKVKRFTCSKINTHTKEKDVNLGTNTELGEV